MYVNGDYGQTNEILSNMETKLVLVLHVDHKPLNIKTTQLNRLRNVNAIRLFIQKDCSSTVHLRLFTVQSLPPQDAGELARRSNVRKQSMYVYVYTVPVKSLDTPSYFLRSFFFTFFIF